MKPTGPVRALRRALLIGGAGLVASCSHATSTDVDRGRPVPQPLAGDIERATFDPSLAIHLDAMTRHVSGMYVQDLTVGKGAVATVGRTAIVRYTGWLTTGKPFDSGEITVALGTNKTIQAWEEGLLGMRVGGTRRLVVPPSLAYGASGAGAIPPNAVLVFEMEMTSVL